MSRPNTMQSFPGFSGKRKQNSMSCTLLAYVCPPKSTLY